MKRSFQRLTAAGAAVLASLAAAVPLAYGETKPAGGTDGALLSAAAEDLALLQELARANPGRGGDGPLVGEALLLHELGHISPGRGGDGALLSRAASRAPDPSLRDEFDWVDAAAGFGVAAWVALLFGGVLAVRKRGLEPRALVRRSGLTRPSAPSTAPASARRRALNWRVRWLWSAKPAEAAGRSIAEGLRRAPPAGGRLLEH
jgi:hypothetical protein